MELILYQDTLAIIEIDFAPGPFRFQIEQQHSDFAVDGANETPEIGWNRGRAALL